MGIVAMALFIKKKLSAANTINKTVGIGREKLSESFKKTVKGISAIPAKIKKIQLIKGNTF